MAFHPAEQRLCALLTPLALWASGCDEVVRDPCFGLRLEESLEIRLVDEYSAAAGYEFDIGRNPAAPLCPPSLRLPLGGSLDVRVVVQEVQRHQSCTPNTVEVTGGSGWELGAQAPSLPLGTHDLTEIVHATHELTVGGCPGSWGLAVESRSGSHGPNGNAFLPATASGYPPIIMHLGFKAEYDARDSAECVQLLGGEASSCTDYYVVELRRP